MAKSQLTEIRTHLDELGDDIHAKQAYLKSLGIYPADIIAALRRLDSPTDLSIYAYIINKKSLTIKTTSYE